MVWVAVLLAVLGAFCLAFGAQRQGSAVKADTGGLALSSNGFLRLLRNPGGSSGSCCCAWEWA